MARRATIFSTPYSGSTLRIAGPYEFTKHNGSSRVDPQNLLPLFKGYDHLGYTLGVLAPEESFAFAPLSDQQPQTWFQAGSRPGIHELHTKNGRIEVVVFPVAPSTQVPRQAMLKNLVARLKQLRTDHPGAIIVGISSWGREAERRFIKRHGGSCDLLLGSGPGGGLVSSFSDNQATLWTRAYSKGRTITKISIAAFPPSTNPHTWKIADHVSTKLVVLNERVQDNPAMVKILSPLYTVAKSRHIPTYQACRGN